MRLSTLYTACYALLSWALACGLGFGEAGAATGQADGGLRPGGVKPELVVQTGHATSLTSLAV